MRLHVFQGLAGELLHLERLNGGFERRGVLLQPEEHGFQLLNAPGGFLWIKRGGQPLRPGRATARPLRRWRRLLFPLRMHLRLGGRVSLCHLLQKVEPRHPLGKIESGWVLAHGLAFLCFFN